MSFGTFLGPNSATPDAGDCGGICHLNGSAPNAPVAQTTATNPDTYAARSRHAGGVNVAMCDGSIRFVPNSIPLPVWQALGSTQGGEANTNY